MHISSFTTNILESHMYLVEENGHALVIDPSDSGMIAEAILSRDLIPDRILLTHEHCDHSYGADAVREQFNCEILASQVCSKNLLSSARNYSRYFEVSAELQTRFKPHVQNRIKPFSCTVDIMFEDERNFVWQGHHVLLKETPGHSEGSICILIDGEILFSGDTLLWGEKTVTRFIGGSKRSLYEVTIPWLESVGTDVLVYPGHFENFILGVRLNDPII